MKLIATITLVFCASLSYGQKNDTAKVKRGTFATYDELRTKQQKYKLEELTYLDSTFSYQVQIPAWLKLRETGNAQAFGGTLPAVKGIENAIIIKPFDKSGFASYAAFKQFVVEGSVFGQAPAWTPDAAFMGKKELSEFTNYGTSYKVYLMRRGLMYHCAYVLVETKSAYLWIDFTATPETFDKNLGKFKEFMSGFRAVK